LHHQQAMSGKRSGQVSRPVTAEQEPLSPLLRSNGACQRKLPSRCDTPAENDEAHVRQLCSAECLNNTAIGTGALLNNTTGFSNVAFGCEAGSGVPTADHVICIDAAGADVIFGCFIGSIYSNVQPIVGTDPDLVTITSSGRLGGGDLSSRRYKHDIKRMDRSQRGPLCASAGQFSL
jgi:hypothetical protein